MSVTPRRVNDTRLILHTSDQGRILIADRSDDGSCGLLPILIDDHKPFSKVTEDISADSSRLAFDESDRGALRATEIVEFCQILKRALSEDQNLYTEEKNQNIHIYIYEEEIP